MFGRSKTTSEPSPEPTQAEPRAEGAKNRPTPKRREQEAARRRPLVVTDRKKARESDRLARRESSLRMRQALATGDERYLPARDKGAVRRYIRDYVDARWSVGEIMLPVMVVVLVLSFLRQSWALMVVFLLVYGLLLVSVVDTALMWRRLRRKLVAKFGADADLRGGAWYAAMRAFQIRRTRAPRPQVARGKYPS